MIKTYGKLDSSNAEKQLRVILEDAYEFQEGDHIQIIYAKNPFELAIKA